MKNSEITDPLFRKAVEAIDAGDFTTLQQLLAANPELVTKPLNTPNERGYFENPYLLWFVADNPIRHERLPANIIEVTRIIIDALQKSKTENYQHIIDYTLGLVGTGRIPKECEVQIPLMDLLIREGAQVKGSVLGAVGQYNFEAAKYLLDKGADYNLATAVAFDRTEDVKKLATTATPSELYVALVVASFFGKPGVISLLIDAGVDVNGNGSSKDFGGFHSHASALHQAVYSGSIECVELLVNAGADVNVVDKAYDGTSLGWAIYMRSEETDENKKKQYLEIENYLRDKQR